MATTIKCPFFRYESHGELLCEGGKIKLPDNENKNKFIHENCGSDDWQSCCISKAMENYYEQRRTK